MEIVLGLLVSGQDDEPGAAVQVLLGGGWVIDSEVGFALDENSSDSGIEKRA